MNKILFASVIAVSPLLADDCCPPLVDSCSCCPGPENARLSLRTTQPGGIGYPTGYSSIDLFYTPGSNANFYPFLDFRAHVFNDGKPAFNTGLGLRYLPDCSEMVWGINAYWDFREAKHASFSQAGLGLEALWADWDLRLNGYVPFSRHKKGYRTDFLKFQGNNAIFYKKYELALAGGDLNLGYYLFRGDCMDMHATLGGYYFQGDYGKHAGGGLFRLSSNLSDYFTASGQVSYDNLFKWTGQGEISLNFAFGKTVRRYERKVSCCTDLISIEKRLVEKPQRFEIMPTTSHKKRGRALDPTTGLPLNFIFVDNTSHSAGTFESPFPTLAQAVAVSKVGDVIYIFPGDGTSTGLNTQTTLKDRQSLVGSGAPFEVMTRFGKQLIPQLSAQAPLISTVGDTIVVGNGNTISGLSLISAIGLTVTNSFSSIPNGFTIEKCSFESQGISLDAASGDIIIQDNSMNIQNIVVSTSLTNTANVTLSRNVINGPSALTIEFFSNNQSKLQAIIEDNAINSTNISFSAVVLIDSFSQSSINARMRNNLINVAATGGNPAVLCQTNNQSTAFFDLENNRINAPTSPSLGIEMQTLGVGNTLVGRLVGNVVNAPGIPPTFSGAAIGFSSATGSTMTLESPNLQLSGLQNINTGHMVQSGTVQFIPMN